MTQHSIQLLRNALRRRHSSAAAVVFVSSLCASCIATARADMITIGGVITQGLPIGGLPDIPASTIQQLSQGDAYTLTLEFDGSVSGTADHTLPALHFTFDMATGKFENEFDFTSLKIMPSGTNDTFTLFACTTPRVFCTDGIRLNLNFSLPSGSIHSQNVVPGVIPDLIPFDLLEQVPNATDMIGSVTSYSYSTAATAVPEPSALAISVLGLVVVAWKRRRDRRIG